MIKKKDENQQQFNERVITMNHYRSLLERLKKHLSIDSIARVLKKTSSLSFRSIKGYLWGTPSPTALREFVPILEEMILPFEKEEKLKLLEVENQQLKNQVRSLKICLNDAILKEAMSLTPSAFQAMIFKLEGQVKDREEILKNKKLQLDLVRTWLNERFTKSASQLTEEEYQQLEFVIMSVQNHMEKTGYSFEAPSN